VPLPGLRRRCRDEVGRALTPAALLRRTVLLCSAATLAFLVSGCAVTDPGDSASSAASEVPAPVAPRPHDLGTPESAVRSYLDWISYSYRLADSSIPTATMTPEEFVRVDAYIQFNLMDGKGIEQSIENMEVRSVSEEATTAVVTAREDWTYRYFSLDTLTYLTEPLAVSYETTYTLVKGDSGWLVDRVEASAQGELR